MILCGTYRDARPRSLAVRVLAVVFVALYLLSAARGLVPGSCLNLRVEEGTVTSVGSTCEMRAISPCCASMARDAENRATPTPADSERCPFCRLAHGVTETPEFVYFTPLLSAEDDTTYPPIACVDSTSYRATLGSRAPPIVSIG